MGSGWIKGNRLHFHSGSRASLETKQVFSGHNDAGLTITVQETPQSCISFEIYDDLAI